MLVDGFIADLPHGDTIKVRNAADFLGATRTLSAMSRRCARRSTAAISPSTPGSPWSAPSGPWGTPAGTTCWSRRWPNPDASVRGAAVIAWRDMLGQQVAAPVVPLLGDLDAFVRAQAAAVVGAMREQSGRATLEALVTRDPDSSVRRNAAWALGQLGNAASRAGADPGDVPTTAGW